MCIRDSFLHGAIMVPNAAALNAPPRFPRWAIPGLSEIPAVSYTHLDVYKRQALMGLHPVERGSVKLNGEELLGRSVKQIIDEGVGFVPEDRTVDGLVGAFSVAENLMLNRSGDPAFVRAGTVRRGALTEFAEEKIDEFDIRTQGASSTAGSLSGGNQQKVVIARELSRDLSLLLVSQPTRGVDVGSIEFIHKRIIETRYAGVPVVVVSTELDERCV